MLVPANESKDNKKYEKLWNKIRHLTRSITNYSGNYDEKHMKIKFDSDNDLPLKKTLELRIMIIVVRDTFNVFMRTTNITHKFS